jgi:hypothetical protein
VLLGRVTHARVRVKRQLFRLGLKEGMTIEEWKVSADPLAMIHWLEEQGYSEALWDFTIACCRRIWNDLPGEAFRQVVEHAEQIGTRDIDDKLAEASRSLKRLERRFQRASDDAEQARLSRQIGFGRTVLAFEHQDAAGSARSICRDLLDWAGDPDAEAAVQAEDLRRLVPDPSHQHKDPDEFGIRR